MENMNFVTLRQEDLIEEATEYLNDYYGVGKWSLVMEDYLDDDSFYLWILQKIDGEFFVIDGDDYFTSEDLFKGQY